MYGKVRRYMNIPIQEFFVYDVGSQCWVNDSTDLC